MPKIKDAYSGPELAIILGCSRKNIWDRANAGRWKYVERPTRQGGNLYPFAALPESIRRVVLAEAFEVNPLFIHDVNLPVAELEAILAEYDAAPDRSRSLAQARALILAATEDHARRRGTGLTAARKHFAELYKKQTAPDITAEIYELIKKLSRSTLEGWSTAYRRRGLAGLLDHKYLNGRDHRVTPEMAMVFRAAIAATPHIRGSKLVELMRMSFAESEWCDRATVYRWYKQWKADNLVEHALELDPSDWKNRYMPAYGTLVTAPHAGHTWEMDSTPADIMTADGKRCAIVAAIDVYSRRVVMVVANTSCSQAVALTIRKGLMTFGKPETIRKDNGKDYSSNHILAVTSGLKIETPKLPPYKSEAKGIIERFFGTISTDMEEMLPGYTGHTVKERAAIRARNTWAKKVFTKPKGWQRDAPKPVVDVPLTQDEFRHMIDCWVDVYENRIHSGFGNERGQKLKGLTPRQAFEKSTHKPRTFKNERLLDILLAKVDNRIVGKKGLRYNNGFYHHIDLMPYTGLEVVIKLNPDNAGALYVFDTAGKFICVARDEALEGQSLSDYMEAQAANKKRLKERIKAANVLSGNLDISYTMNLLSGQIAKANRPAGHHPDNGPAEGEALEFRPEYQSEATDEARKAYEAYDGTAEPAAPAGTEALEFTPKIIYPQSPAEEEDPDMPKGREAGNPCIMFKYYMNKATGAGIPRAEVKHIFRLWNDFAQVQKLFDRPDEEHLNIIEPAVKPPVKPGPDKNKEVHL